MQIFHPGKKKKKIFFWNVLKTSGSAKLLLAIFGTFFLPLQAERSKEHKKTFFRSRERSFGVKKSFFFLCFFRCALRRTTTRSISCCWRARSVAAVRLSRMFTCFSARRERVTAGLQEIVEKLDAKLDKLFSRAFEGNVLRVAGINSKKQVTLCVARSRLVITLLSHRAGRSRTTTRRS
jgi:hypothetical protein